MFDLFWRMTSARIDRNRIQRTELIAWLQIYHIRLTTLEINALEKMDEQYIMTLNEETKLNDERRRDK